MTILFFKILPFLFTDIQLDRLVLPLFKIKTQSSATPLYKASFFLYNKLDSFLKKKFSDNPIKLHNSLDKINTYFDQVQSAQVYDNLIHSNKVSDSLCSLTTFLTDLSSDTSFDIDQIFEELFMAIDERACFDDHIYNLDSILLQLSFTQFSAPVRKVIQHIYNKMDDQIRLQLLSLDHNIFKGFKDRQSTHSHHIAILILDDLFNIAGGSLANDADILIKRTHLATTILKKIFDQKLSLGSVLASSDSDWISSLTRDLSCSTSYLGQAYISLQDLIKSTDFLDFLILNKHLTEDQKLFLLDLPENCDQPAIDFLDPLVKVCTKIGQESTVYTRLFTHLLLTFIHQKILPASLSPSPVIPSFSHSPIPDPLLTKVVSLFANPPSSERFSYSDICTAMRLSNSEFQVPFLKPYLSLSTLMMAYCQPSHAVKIFNNWLSPKGSLVSTRNCLILMGINNHEAVRMIGVSEFLSDKFKSTKTRQPLFFRILLDHPNTIKEWLEKKIISSKILSSIKTDFDNSLLHVLFHHYPQIVESWFNLNLITMSDLIDSKDCLGSSILHRVSDKKPLLLEQWVEKKFISISKLLKIRNVTGNSVILFLAKYHSKSLETWVENKLVSVNKILYNKNNYHCTVGLILARYNPQTLIRWIQQGVVTIKDLTKSIDKFGDSICHRLAIYNPKVLQYFLIHDHLSFKDLFQTVNNESNSLIHYLVLYSPSIVKSCLDEKRISIQDLINHKNSFDDTALHWIAEHSPSMLIDWIDEQLLSVHELFTIKNKKGNTVMHVLCRIAPEVVADWIRKKWIPIQQLFEVKDNCDYSLIYVIANSKPEILELWINQNLITFSQLVCLSPPCICAVIHVIALHHPDILIEWIEKGYISPQDFLDTKDSSGHSVAHYLSQQTPRILLFLVQHGYLAPQELLIITDNSNNSVIHWLAKHNPKAIMQWLEDGKITIQELLHSQNTYGHSIIHLLTTYYPELVLSLNLTNE